MNNAKKVVLPLCAAVLAHVLIALLLYRGRSRGLSPLLGWDVVAFALPLLAASAAYFAVFGGVVRGATLSWRNAAVGLLALVLGVVVQAVAMTFGANLYGT